MNTTDLLVGLPGESLLREGLADVTAGRHTIPAYLIAIASPRMRDTGFIKEPSPDLQEDAELKLYRLLGKSEGDGKGDAYARYNALLRELVSFEHALDRRLSAKT